MDAVFYRHAQALKAEASKTLRNHEQRGASCIMVLLASRITLESILHIGRCQS